jgi:hypothetical protein
VVEHVRVLSEEMLYVTYTKCEDYIEVMSHTNPVIAAFTTANCRLKLYEELEKLGDRVCYFDTGRKIHTQPPGACTHDVIFQIPSSISLDPGTCTSRR